MFSGGLDSLGGVVDEVLVQRKNVVLVTHKSTPKNNRILRDLTEQIIAKLVAVLELRDPDLATHGRRTAEIATAIGGQLGLDLGALERLYEAGQLHDIGKLGVSESILWKPAGLNRIEWREIRTHPEEGHRLVADVVHPDVAGAVLYHHERMDGDGYPFGIDGMTVSVTARVVQVADAIDAMTSDRPYQGALPMEIARDEIRRCAGTQFDPEVVAAAVRAIDERLEKTMAADPAPAAEPVDPFEGSPSMIRLWAS
jgi:HD-GYP domain-containing protein (c-di-GMP phosphodiesterase class II)